MWRGKCQSPRSGIINSGIITSIKHMSLIKFREIMKDREAWWAAVHGVAVRYSWATEQQQRKREMFSLTGKGNRAQWRESHSIMSNSLRPHGLYSPWNSSGQNTGVGSLSFPGDLPNPGVEPRSPTLQVDSLPAEPQGKTTNAGVGSLPLLQWIFPTQESNWGVLHFRQILYQLSYQGSPNRAQRKKRSHSVVSDSLQPHGLEPTSSSVHGILQARVLEWIAIPFSRGSSLPRDWTQVSCIAGKRFTTWAIREDQEQ